MIPYIILTINRYSAKKLIVSNKRKIYIGIFLHSHHIIY